MSLTSTPKIPAVDPNTSNKKEFGNTSLTSTSTVGEDNQLTRKPANATATARSDSPTVLWSIEDGVRPSTITAANNNNQQQGNSFSPTNLFGSPSSNSNTGGGGGFLNLPLPSTLMALKQKQAAAIATHNSIASRNAQQNNILKSSLDQSQPLLPLRAFLASRNQNSSISKTLAATSVNSFQSRFDSSNKTIPYFSRQNIENICVNLRIETIEEFCCFPAAKISEASAVQIVFSNDNIRRKSPQATSTNPSNSTSNEKNDPTSPKIVTKHQTPMVDPVVSFLAVSDAHRELKRVGARIDWARRLRPIYDKYCPARIPQLPMLLQAYNGEEESLWRSVREKYEHDYAVAAALLEVQSDHEVNNNNHSADGNENNNNENNASMEQMRNQLQQQQQTITMLQQMYAQSQDDLRSLAHEYNEAIAGLTDRAEKAEAEVGKLRLVNVEQLEWIKVLEQRLSSVNNSNANNNNNQGSSSVNLSSPLAAKILNSPQMIYQQQQQQQYMSSPFNNNNNAAASVRSSSPSNNNAGSIAAMNVQKVNVEIRHYLRNKLTDFYAKYDPSRVPEVDAVLEQWKGKEVELDRLLETPPAGRY